MYQKNINNPFEVPQRILIRGDSQGRISIWSVPEYSAQEVASVVTDPDKIIINTEDNIYSLKKSWESLRPLPGGIFDQFITEDRPRIKITASVYLPFQGRLVCGREDGSIIIISATYTIMAHLLTYRRRGRPGQYDDIWSQHQILEGHSGRVNCLLYPHHSHERYDIAYLLSGGVDFSVCLWDIYSGTLLHRFSVHAGEITQICVPPKDCSPRILQSVCSIASDHSVAILSLKEKKCIMNASRHLFPIQVIKWRPLDDFMVVGCTDGSVYVWQMETGHLDRVVQGINAEEILAACDEHAISTSGDKLTNPALHLLRGMRHRNLAAIRHAAARGLTHLVGQHHQEARDVVDTSIQARSHPLMIQGLKANPKDQNCHVLFFDLESMIVNLLSEEYALLSPNTLESQGLTSNAEYHKFLTMSCSPEGHNKLSGLFAKVKENAGSAAQKIQSKAEKVGFKPGSAEVSLMRKGSGAGTDTSPSAGTPTKASAGKVQFGETKLTMEIAQLILSLLHAWGLDPDLDRVCESKLGLLRPLRPVCFGILAKNGHMSLLLPMRIAKMDDEESVEEKEGKHIKLSAVEMEKVLEESRAQRFAARIHWELSTAITTSHLLSIISLANTLMSMSSATFIAEQERKRRLYRRLSRADSRGEIELCEGLKGLDAESLAYEQQQIKQGWSLLAALHCVLLPEHLKASGFKRPLLEVLARRWQDRCLEIREAAQALLLAELRRLGSKGRKQLVDEWAPFLPPHTETATMTALTQRSAVNDGHQLVMMSNVGNNYNQGISPSQAGSGVNSEANSIRESRPSFAGTDIGSNPGNDSDEDVEDIEDHVSEFGAGSGHGGEETSRRTSTTSYEDRRRQMTAIILLGVIGAEYGHEVEQSKRRVEPEEVDQRKKSVVEGFGAGNYSLARHTAHSLAFLLLVKPSRALPLHTSHRRAAIDLLGRGFTVWEPYLDVSKVLLALLELCCESEKMVPSMSFGLPLTPAADSCRTAKHSISLIATARPAAFITTLAKEVARYNAIQQNPQSMSVNLFNTVLSRAKPEILRNIELLIDKMPSDVGDLIIESMDIILHCLDLNNLKSRTLNEVFPSISKFPNVTFCPTSKRIAVGSKNGIMAIFELRTPQKSQTITAHSQAVTCCTFAPDGKHLATYSMDENKICFWSTATSLFGLGQSQTKCVRTYNTKPVSRTTLISLQDPYGSKSPPVLVWVANKALILMFADGSECRYSV